MSRLAVCLLLLFPLLSHAAISCHLHSPVSDQSNTPPSLFLGPYANQEQCEQENAERYQMQGYCHCGFANNFKSLLNAPDGRNNRLGIMR